MNKPLPISLESQTNEFADLLIGKGYDQTFRVGSDATGKIREALREHVQNEMYQNHSIAPFSMEAYTKWNGDDKDNVHLRLTVSHDQQSGFKIDYAHIKLKNEYGNLQKMVSLSPSDNNDMPTAEKCNKLVDSYNQYLQRKKDRTDTITAHGSALAELLADKGYRHFDGPLFTESVSESLRRRSAKLLATPQDDQFTLATMIKMPAKHSLDQSRQYIRCMLHGKYDQGAGFLIKNISARLIKNAFGTEYTIRNREFPINTNSAIPSPNDLRQFLTHTRRQKQRHQI
jgi:hypothetical protein